MRTTYMRKDWQDHLLDNSEGYKHCEIELELLHGTLAVVKGCFNGLSTEDKDKTKVMTYSNGWNLNLAQVSGKILSASRLSGFDQRQQCSSSAFRIISEVMDEPAQYCFHSSLWILLSDFKFQAFRFCHHNGAYALHYLTQQNVAFSIFRRCYTILKKNMIKCKLYLRECNCYQFLYDKSKHHVTL